MTEIFTDPLDKSRHIHDVRVRRLRVNRDPRGVLVETLRADWEDIFDSGQRPFAQSYYSITDPNVAYILMMIGLYGLILEFYNPGLGVGGIVGIICLLVGAYALQMLPINYAGLALIIVGIGLMVAEAFTPSFGILGVGGLAAFVIGSIILMDTDLPGYQISMPIIAGVATASAALVFLTVGAAVRARMASVVSGAEAMIGTEGEVLDDFERAGRVRAAGEVWQARSREPLEKGARVTVAALEGVRLEVKRADEDIN